MLTGLHQNWALGSYLNDLLDFIKRWENDPLRQNPGAVDIPPTWDGGDSIAIGYGFDLLVRTNTEINNYLAQAGLPPLTKRL